MSESRKATDLARTSIQLPLIDRHHRVHRSMRISVTDVCNIRCQYCMPDGQIAFLPQDRHLSYSQIARIVAACTRLGIHDYRITGGEPLMRPNLDQLIARLTELNGVDQVAITTNGMLLKSQLPALMQAGLKRVNISLDTLNDATFQRMSRRAGLERVLEGVEAALDQPQLTIRLNALILRDVNLNDVVELVKFARSRQVTIRFIEFMPLDGSRSWSTDRMVSGHELRQHIADRVGALHLVPSDNPSQPSTDYQFEDGSRVGFIDSVTSPFCNRCDRIRLTSDGKLRNCLFGTREWNVTDLLAAYTDELQFRQQFEVRIRECVMAKAAAHGIDQPSFQQPERAMYQIGG